MELKESPRLIIISGEDLASVRPGLGTIYALRYKREAINTQMKALADLCTPRNVT
jgi:hypothetical protein